MNYLEHPCQHIINFLRTQPEVKLQFSIYEYSPQTLFDHRHIIDIPSSELNFEWVSKTISKLRPGEELAFHSRYKYGKKFFHIPMIDFHCPPENFRAAYSALSKILPNVILSGLVFYDSGRSFHAYGSKPLDNANWVKFMGRLLLANLPNQTPIVDTRWVGHRLLGSYASLRWSSNSSQYLKEPTLINHLQLSTN